MSYIEANLLSDEHVVYTARLHWIIFLKPLAVMFLGLIFLFIQPIIAAVVILIGLAAFVPRVIEYISSEFGVTNKRVIIKVGFVRRRTVELLLRQVEAISVDQSVTGRILDFGSLTLSGTGGVTELFHNVQSPLEFRRRIQGEAA